MPILIKSARLEPDPMNPDAPGVVVLVYDLPVSHRAGGASDTTSHEHVVGYGAIATRMALYGHRTVVDVLEEIIYEALAPDGPDGGFPHKSQRDEHRNNNKVNGLAQAIRGLTLPVPPEDVLLAHEQQALHVLGHERVAKVRGVDVSELPAKRNVRYDPKADQDAVRHGRPSGR